MADKSPDSPVYHENEVIKDPEAPNAVQIPQAANDGTREGAEENFAANAEAQTPNEVAGDDPNAAFDTVEKSSSEVRQDREDRDRVAQPKAAPKSSGSKSSDKS